MTNGIKPSLTAQWNVTCVCPDKCGFAILQPFNDLNLFTLSSMQREALLTKAVMHIAQLINECKYECKLYWLNLVAVPLI